MNAEELMLYDWVLVKDKPLRALKLSIGEVYDARPIPITPETLARYGWKQTGGLWWVLKGKARLGWNERTKEMIVGFSAFPAQIEYVHQLQHLLRLLDMKDMTI